MRRDERLTAWVEGFGVGCVEGKGTGWKSMDIDGTEAGWVERKVAGGVDRGVGWMVRALWTDGWRAVWECGRLCGWVWSCVGGQGAGRAAD